jgi:hypothetical protein
MAALTRPTELTELGLECLEYQEGFLSGLMLTASGQPEQTHRYASRYAAVLALQGRVKEHEYYGAIANAATRFIGRAASKAWNERPSRSGFLAGTGARILWEQAYTDSLLMEADDALRRIQDDTDTFRKQIARHFNKAGARRR